jgi:DNA-binding transcriptional ArsR family regulator
VTGRLTTFNRQVKHIIVEMLNATILAISDPTRRAILDRLARGPARVTDVAEPFAMSLAAVSKHVKVLEQAGLVRRAKNGREHTLELDAAPLREVAQWTARYEDYWTERLDRLEAYFNQRKKSQ